MAKKDKSRITQMLELYDKYTLSACDEIIDNGNVKASIYLFKDSSKIAEINYEKVADWNKKSRHKFFDALRKFIKEVGIDYVINVSETRMKYVNQANNQLLSDRDALMTILESTGITKIRIYDIIRSETDNRVTDLKEDKVHVKPSELVTGEIGALFEERKGK